MKEITIDKAWRGAERCKNCAIRHLVLFSDLSHQDFDRIHQPIDDLEYEPGTRLYHQGEELRYVYTVRSGLIKLVQHLPNGTQRIVRLLRQGDLAGLEGLGGQVADHDAVTLDHASVCRIPVPVIRDLQRETPNLHDSLMRRWQKALSGADNWITRLSTGNARQRVARLLLLLDEASTDDSFFLPTREDMGAMLGITTESASKVTADFRRRGWLKPLGGHRAWIDARALQEEVD
ncbi:MAG TPA: Crp/Fnr family transcriptional regulator [Gammaproteobacteria bacterium]|nr:Crp/Fnr family transcriptional regulator [Gammaproteobacteria bacterium]